MNIGENIKALRKQKSFTQKEVADFANTTQTTIANIEAGITKYPSVDIAIKIADALGTNVYDLFGDENFIVKYEDLIKLEKEIELLKNQLKDKTLIIELLLKERKQSDEPTH